MIKRFVIYIPAPEPTVIVGYKGRQYFEPGIVKAPYIPRFKPVDLPPSSSKSLTSGKNLLQLD